MHLNHATQDNSHVIPVTPRTPNRHTPATIRIADACHDHAGLIATRITANTGTAKTRHTAAMRLLHAGNDITVIALWLGHENITTTQIYLKADITLKQRAIDRTVPQGTKPGRYKPPDRLLSFLENL